MISRRLYAGTHTESTRLTSIQIILAAFVAPLFGIILALALSSLTEMSTNPRPSDSCPDEDNDQVAALAEVQQSQPEPMEVQGNYNTDTDIVPQSEDKQSTPERMEVDPHASDNASHGEDVVPQDDRKVEETGADEGDKVRQHAYDKDMGDAGGKDNVKEHADDTGKTDAKNMGEVGDKDNVKEHADDTGKTDAKNMGDVGDKDNVRQIASDKDMDDVGDKYNKRENADDTAKTDDKDMTNTGDKDNVREHADDIRKTDDKAMDDAGDIDDKAMDDAGDIDNKRENADDIRKTDDKAMDDAGDVDNKKENADDIRKTNDKAMDDASDIDNKRENADDTGKTDDKDMADDSDKDNIRQHTDDKTMDDAGDKNIIKENADATRKTDDKDTDDGGFFSPRTKKYDFPNTLEGFGYAFNDKGELRHIETDDPFEFQVSLDHAYNQKRYEAIGELITEYVYGLLETEAHMKRIWLPTDAPEEEARSFFFTTEDASTNTDKLLILIHGSGVVRAGQWARRLIINDNLDCGTQLPFIKKAVEDGYGVMVLNTNLNRVTQDGKQMSIRENSTPDNHALYVWDNFVANAKAAHIAIVAHSYGGVVTTNLLRARTNNFLSRVFAVAFTDSVHSVPVQHACQQFYKKNAQNWISSSDPLDTEVDDYYGYDANLVSAGDPRHEWTSWSSFPSIFKFFTQKYTEHIKSNSGEEDSQEEEDKAPQRSTQSEATTTVNTV